MKKEPIQVTILDRVDQTRKRVETKAIILAFIDENGNPVVRMNVEGSEVDKFCLYVAIKRYSEKIEEDNPKFKALYQELEEEGAFINERRGSEALEVQEEEPPEVEEEDPDAHTCDYDEYGECKICGAIQYKSCLWFELYGGEP